jgi:REP element-mobilizing transposase RayT
MPANHPDDFNTISVCGDESSMDVCRELMDVCRRPTGVCLGLTGVCNTPLRVIFIILFIGSIIFSYICYSFIYKNCMSKNYPNRRSIRLRGYDYAQAGFYFVTICARNREFVFGHIAHGEMILNYAGEIAQDCWLETARIRPNVILGDFVVMPNHFHAVFAIDYAHSNDNAGGDGGVLHTPASCPPANHPDDFNTISVCGDESSTDVCRGPAGVCPELTGVCNTPLRTPSQTVGAIVRGYKSMVSKRIGYSVWQRNFHEHIIRNERSLHQISQYIVSNPARWQDDCFYVG